MTRFFDFIREEILWVVITLSLGAGLIGSYGRERHEGRRPGRDWWLNRFYIFPFLAILSAAITDQFKLTQQQIALVSSLLALMSYEAVAMITERFKKRGAAVLDAAIDSVVGSGAEATAKPYASVIDTDDAGRPTAHVVTTPEDPSMKGAVGAAARGVYHSSTIAKLPADQQHLLNKLGDIDLGDEQE